MKGKTNVRIIEDNDYRHCKLKKGMEGYIDGYVQTATGIPHAVIVSGDIIGLMPIYALEVLTEPNPMTEDEVETYLNEILK